MQSKSNFWELTKEIFLKSFENYYCCLNQKMTNTETKNQQVNNRFEPTIDIKLH